MINLNESGVKENCSMHDFIKHELSNAKTSTLDFDKFCMKEIPISGVKITSVKVKLCIFEPSSFCKK